MSERIPVTRSVKLFLGDWRRPESGRMVSVGPAQVPVASRKDLRDAVRVSRAAQSVWEAKTPYLRAQILYRFAEMVEARRDSLVADIVTAERAHRTAPVATPSPNRRFGDDELVAAGSAGVDHLIDQVVRYAGIPDKLAQLLGSTNNVTGPFLSVSAPAAGGVVATFPVSGTPLDAVASYADAVCAPLACGSSVIVTVAPSAYLGLVGLTEAWAASDVPAGTVCQLSAVGAELPRTAAGHSDVDALDVSGLDTALATECLELAAESLTRVRHDASPTDVRSRLRFASELRTVWLPAAL